jgi:hypothetical protein
MEKPEVGKASHEEVGYETKSKQSGESCSRCEHFIDAEPARCKTVVSPIELQGWCKKFEVDPDRLTHAEYREWRNAGGGKDQDQDSIQTADYRRSRESRE